MVAGLIYNPANEEMFIAERGKGAFLNDQRIRVAAPQAARRRGRSPAGCRISAAAISRSAQGDRRGAGRTSPACAASAPPRSISPGSPPAGSTAIGSATSSPGTWRPGLILVREAGGFVTDCDGGDDMFAKGHIVAGNETIQKELLRVLKTRQAKPRRVGPQFQLNPPLYRGYRAGRLLFPCHGSVPYCVAELRSTSSI